MWLTLGPSVQYSGDNMVGKIPGVGIAQWLEHPTHD